jgi:signal transduction histidine kinase
VLDCLLGNALKFTVRGGVSVRAWMEADGRSVVEVRDTGPGFDMAEAPRLFARFQQADGSSTRRHGGSGLGLPIARGFALLMGGTLEAEGRPGEGAAFRLALPLEPAEPMALRMTG